VNGKQVQVILKNKLLILILILSYSCQGGNKNNFEKRQYLNFDKTRIDTLRSDKTDMISRLTMKVRGSSNENFTLSYAHKPYNNFITIELENK